MMTALPTSQVALPDKAAAIGIAFRTHQFILAASRAVALLLQGMVQGAFVRRSIITRALSNP